MAAALPDILAGVVVGVRGLGADRSGDIAYQLLLELTSGGDPVPEGVLGGILAGGGDGDRADQQRRQQEQGEP